ncbi:MAG: YceI family protein [Bacteroidetes bacterium]|nr:YceI family protein [Bacteroidota bacterium]
MKTRFNKMLIAGLALLGSYGIFSGCTHKDIIPPSSASTTPIIHRGTHIHLAGQTAGDTTQWKFDKVHSAVNWSTPFLEVGADLTGKFNQFGVADLSTAQLQNYTTAAQPVPDTSFAFYENDPAKTHFAGYVQINQVNTGEPRRDAGCLVTTLATTAIVNGTQNLTVQNVARIKTTSVAFDPTGNDYIVTLDFTWQGGLAAPLTESITGKLTYIPEAVVPAGTYSDFGLKLEFQINKADFGINSTETADKIDIVVSANFNNK